MSSKTRAIDKIPIVTKRPVEMEVLCLGLSRTSTMSMAIALNKLGYKTHHFVSLVLNHTTYPWLEAMEAKVHGNGKVFGRVEFDKLLQHHSAVTDTPCVNHYKELLEAYPNAKVVLTSRDPDKWVDSVNASFHKIIDYWMWKYVEDVGLGSWFIDFTGMREQENVRKLLRMALEDWSDGKWEDREALKAGFLAHNTEIRRIVPPDRLLEFSPKQGWKPLCEFLGKDTPEEPFPFMNKGDNIANLAKKALFFSMFKASWKPALITVVAWKWRPITAFIGVYWGLLLAWGLDFVNVKG